MDSETIIYILVALAGFTVVLFVAAILLVGFVLTFGRRWLMRFLMADPSTIERETQRLRQQFPAANPDQLAAKLIERQALFTGAIGLVAGIGGGFTFILGAPVDFMATMRRQLRLVQGITAIYGNDDLDHEMLQLKYAALVLGGHGAGTVLGKFLVRYIPKLVGGSIPGLGGLVGGGVNWAVTQSIGRAAITWNKGYTLRAEATHKLERAQGFARQLRPLRARPVAVA